MIIRKGLLRFSVLLLTFAIGCLVQFSLRRTDAPAPGKAQTAADWKRITIGRVSFHVPPDMEPTLRFRTAGMQTLHAVDGEDLHLYYAYGSAIPTDVNAIPSQSRQVTVSGVPAWIRKWEQREELPWSGLYQPGIQLVVTDVGDGNKFELYAVAADLTIVQKVIETVEIH